MNLSTNYDADRARRQEQWAEEYKARTSNYYKELEDRGINTSAANIKREGEPVDIDFIWCRLVLRRG